MLIFFPAQNQKKSDVASEPALTKQEKDSLQPLIQDTWDYLNKVAPIEKSPDWAFMEASNETLTHMPATWSVYPKDTKGMASIIDMEHTEFQNAFSQNMAKEDQMRELVHLASACLYYWRYLNAQ